MVVWGGLRPVTSQIVLDAAAVMGISLATFSPLQSKGKSRSVGNGALLLGSLLLTICTSGNFTNRWTLTFPFSVLVLLQLLRRISFLEQRRWSFWIIRILSALLIVIAIKLSILFPAVELPPIEGPFNVGTIDVHIPAHPDSSVEYLPVRILYPTFDSPQKLPYLNPDTAVKYCEETMRFGAPGPLRDFGWMLHTWRLTHIPAAHQAALVPGASKFPVVVYSHGLGGNADIYSYQTMSLAAKGSVVVVMNHLDGSGPVVQTKCGNEVTFDHETPKLPYKEIEEIRKASTDLRVQEVITATEAVMAMDREDTEELVDSYISFNNRLQLDHISVMGHSFGGATALTASKRRPDIFKAVIAHEPATGWMPDEARKLFFEEKIQGLELEEHLFEKDNVLEELRDSMNKDLSETSNLPESVDTLVLFSHEWREKGWGRAHLFQEIHKQGRLGPETGVAHFSFIQDAHHNEFSDTCMLTPLWLARSVGATGKRNPLETAQEIHNRTMAFLLETWARHGVETKFSRNT